MPNYQPVLHPTAERELNQLPSDAKDRLTSVLKNIAEQRQPTSHEKVRQLEGQPGLFRVRVGNYRAILALEKPELRVLKVGNRRKVYDDVDDIREQRGAVG